MKKVQQGNESGDLSRSLGQRYLLITLEQIKCANKASCHASASVTASDRRHYVLGLSVQPSDSHESNISRMP